MFREVCFQDLDVVPSVRDAISESIRLSKARRDQKIENARNGGRFCDWLGKRYPTVRTFDQIKPYMIQEYINEAEEVRVYRQRRDRQEVAL